MREIGYLALTDSVDRTAIETAFNTGKKRAEDALQKYQQEQIADSTDEMLLKEVSASCQDFAKSRGRTRH